MMYKAGIETKTNIVNSARELFRKRGFRDTSVHMIAERANAKLGTFTYYFPKKEDLIRYLYESYMSECRKVIDEAETDLKPAERHIYTVMLYYRNLYRDERCVSFHKEILEKASMNLYFVDPAALIREFSEEGDVEENSSFYRLVVTADNAVRRELNMSFIEEKDYSLPRIRELLRDIYSLNAKLFGIPQEHIDRYLEDAYRCLTEREDIPVSLL